VWIIEESTNEVWKKRPLVLRTEQNRLLVKPKVVLQKTRKRVGKMRRFRE